MQTYVCEFTERPLKAEYIVYNKYIHKYLLIRIPQTNVIYQLRIVAYVSLHCLINLSKSVLINPKNIKENDTLRTMAFTRLKKPCQTIKKTKISLIHKSLIYNNRYIDNNIRICVYINKFI